MHLLIFVPAGQAIRRRTVQRPATVVQPERLRSSFMVISEPTPKTPRQNAAALAWVRTSRGYSLRALARELDTSHGYLSNLESGKASASPAFLERMAAVFGCDVDILRSREVDPPHRRRAKSVDGGGS